MARPVKTLLRLLLVLLFPATAVAAPVPSYVTEFFTGLDTLQANFDQQVMDGRQ